MDLDAAQLSSLATSLSDIVDRVTAMAETFQASPREDIAADLYDVERNLQSAHRRLRALVAKLS